MSSHLPLLPFINHCSLSFSIHTSSFQFLKNPSPLKFALPQARQWRRQEELILSGRGYARAPLPLSGPPLQAPDLPSPPPLQSAPPLPPPPPLPPQPAPALTCLLYAPLLPLLPLPQLLYRALLLVMLRVPPLWPMPKGDIIPGLGPLHPLLRIPIQPEGPHRPRRPGLHAQGSHPLRDPGRHPLHLIRVLPEPQTYLRHPSLGGPTSLATPSLGMLTAEGDISMERFTTISQHLPWTRSSETPCSLCSDTIWSRSWCRVSSIILGSSSSSIIR